MTSHFKRVFAKDTSLWTSDAEVSKKIDNRLGWLDSIEFCQNNLNEIENEYDIEMDEEMNISEDPKRSWKTFSWKRLGLRRTHITRSRLITTRCCKNICLWGKCRNYC